MVDGKLTTITNNTYLNMDKWIEASMDTLKTRARNIHNIMSAMAMEFQQSNNRIHNIMQTFAATSPEAPPTTIARLRHAPSTWTTLLCECRAESGEHRGSKNSKLGRLNLGLFNSKEYTMNLLESSKNNINVLPISVEWIGPKINQNDLNLKWTC